jgi:hypothetical protein
VGKTEGKKSHLKTWCKWEKNIKTDLYKPGGEEWID